MDHGKWEWRRGRNAHGNGRVAQWERDGSGRSSMGGQGTSIYPPGGPAGVPGWTRTAGMEAEGVDGAFIRGPVEAEFESGSRRSRRLSGIGRTWNLPSDPGMATPPHTNPRRSRKSKTPSRIRPHRPVPAHGADGARAAPAWNRGRCRAGNPVTPDGPGCSYTHCHVLSHIHPRRPARAPGKYFHRPGNIRPNALIFTAFNRTQDSA